VLKTETGMIATEFWGVKASGGRCIAPKPLCFEKFIDGLLFVFATAKSFKKLASTPVRLSLQCVKLPTDNTFAATVVKKRI
jgi:hypothetical protein